MEFAVLGETAVGHTFTYMLFTPQKIKIKCMVAFGGARHSLGVQPLQIVPGGNNTEQL